jgi:hypothetical protein
MAPKTIAIHKNTGGIDPISPLPDRVNDFPKSKIPTPPKKSRFLSGKPASRKENDLDDLKNKYEETKVQMEEMKRQKSANDKKLFEMSGLVKSLQGIPVNYNKTIDGNNFGNVQRKIEAIMYEMNEAKKRYDELRDERFFQKDTIISQETQIKNLEDQIVVLNERLQKEELEQSKVAEKNTQELEQQVMLQEMEIMNVTAEIDQLKSRKATEVGNQIKLQEASNAAKYAEIEKMEEKLASMREEQIAQKMRQEQEPEFVMKPSSATFKEVNKLEDEVANFRLEQEKTSASEHLQKPKPINARTSSSKSQPWNQDLEQKESINKKKTELEVVANNDIGYEEQITLESVDQGEIELSLPSLTNENQVVKSPKLNRQSFGSTSRSVSSENTPQSLESIAEEYENEPEEIQQSKTVDSASNNTEATGGTSSSSFSEIQATKVPLSDEDSPKGTAPVDIVKADDGSIEAISKPELKAVLSQSSDDDTASRSSGGSSTCTESSRESSGESSSGIYSSETSTQSSSRSILEQIPEGVEGETDDSDSEFEGSQGSQSAADSETKDLQAGSLLLRKQLKESETKYGKLMDDYKQLVAKSQLRMEKLEEENSKLRKGKGGLLGSFKKGSKDEDSELLKKENKKLLKSMEKQNEVMEKAGKNYDKLQKEHDDTLAELAEKKKRYDKLVLDFSSIRGNEDYNRLKALHHAVVLKLADMGEDNDRLERERDTAIDELESKNVQLRAFDEAIASLNKTESDLKMLESVHEETIVELQQLGEKNKELKELYENETANAKYAEKIQKEYETAKTEVETLSASNKELKCMQEKLNASEAKLSLLEEEDKQTKQKLIDTKKKSKARADQLKDVIAQYKTLKEDYSLKCDELKRLVIATKGLKCRKAIEEMKAMDVALQQAKKEASEAASKREARENDLKIVLHHYEKLQKKFEVLNSKPFDESSAESQSQSFDVSPSVEEEKKEGSIQDESSDPVGDKNDDLVLVEPIRKKIPFLKAPVSNIVVDKKQEELQNLEKQLKSMQESMAWKDDTIAKTLKKLKEAKEEITILEIENKELEAELSKVESKLSRAKKETGNAQNKEGEGQSKLRDAITEHQQLKDVYDSLLKKYENAEGELKNAKLQFAVKDQEEKHARKRATSLQTQLKKLQEDHNVVVRRSEKLKKELTAIELAPAEC